MGLFDWLKSTTKPTAKVKLESWKVSAIRLQTKNLVKNVEIVNTSNNYDSAVVAFDAACNALQFLSDFSDEEIQAAGCSISRPPAPYLSYLLENRDALLEKVCLRSQTAKARRDAEELRQLEQALPGFASFVKSSFDMDGDLPPIVLVRDSLPLLYARFGMWEKAESVIRLAISCGAYGHTEYRNSRDHKGHWIAEPEEGENQLKFLQECHTTADATLAYLSKNPGILQSKIYKIPALSEVNHDALVWFCRNSHQIRKEKDGKTNRLYVAEALEEL